jgi:hypothetical protein
MFPAINRIRAVLTRPKRAADGAYRVFTLDYDVEAEADEISSVLGPWPESGMSILAIRRISRLRAP